MRTSVRIGNDIKLMWQILDGGVPVNLMNATDIKVSIAQGGTPSCNKIEITTFEVTDAVNGMIAVEVQKEVITKIGYLWAVLEYTVPDSGMIDGNRKVTTDNLPVKIVGLTDEASQDSEFTVSSDIQAGFQGKSAYEVWLVENPDKTLQDYFDWLQQPATDIEQVVSSNETVRISSEETRQLNETARIEAETLRGSAETQRISDENTRKSNETGRINAETLRLSAEEERGTAEGLRASSETSRNTAEGQRAAAETARATAEGLRQSNTATAIQQAASATTAANTAAGLADAARLAIEGELALKADQTELDQLAGDVALKVDELSVFIESIIKNGNMVDTSNWLSRYTGSALTASDNILSLTSSAGANIYPSISQLGIGSNFANKKLYIEYEVSVNNDICKKLQCRLETPELIVKTKSAPAADTWYKESFIAQVSPLSTSDLNIIFQSEYQSGTDLDGKILRLKNVKIFDLTGIFGVGNEPDSNEFIQILSSIGDLYTTGVMLNKKLYADILKKANHGYTGSETIKTLKDVDLFSIHSKQDIDYDLEYDIAQKKEHTYSVIGSGVNSNGNFFAEGNTKRTDYIPVKTGDAISYINNLSNFYCALAFYDINKAFLSDLKILGAGRNSGTHMVSDSRVRYVVLTDYKSQPIVSVSYLLESRKNTADILLLQQQDLAIKKEQLLDSMYVFFENVIAIGDSVTAGTITDDPRFSGLVTKYSYPTQLSKLTGWTIVNSAVPGYTAKKWWNDRYALHTYTDFQLAIMEFGYNSALTDTIETDVDPYASYLDFADTETGHYCRVIQAIKTQNPNIFFVLMISSAISGTTPDVIIKIGLKYNIPVIDLRDNSIVNLSSTDYHGLYGGGIDSAHFNAIGYAAKAQYIKYELNKIFIERAKEINDLRID